MILIAELSLWASLFLAAWSAAISYAGGALRLAEFVESGARALYATFVMAALASVGLWTALLARDFSLEYVAANIGQNTPRHYAFTALWSGQSGSMLFCATILSLCGTVVVAASGRRSRELVPWATGTLSAILLFLLATTCFAANPFARSEVTPLDGRGMNPLLQNPAMALHQPMLYIGYVATAVSFAFAIAALLGRRLDANWFDVARRWTVVSWVFLTGAIVLGMRSGYLKPTSGAGWALNAVEDWSVFPWLTVTASLHSIFARTRLPDRRKWNVVFFAASFLLAVLAVVVTRGGAMTDETTLAPSPIGTWFSSFFFLTTGMTVYLIGTRLRDLQATAGAEAESTAQNRRRVGEYVVHAGFVISLVAIAAVPFRREYDARLKTGESYQATDPYGHVWRFVSQGVSQFDRPDHVVAILALDTYRDGKRVGLITSERRTYRDIQGNQLFPPSVEVGVHSSAGLDTYVTPADIRREEGSDIARLQVAFNPLVVWLWVGGLVMTAGGLIVLWPHGARRGTHTEYAVA
jgi:cytochrome c biogenesis factor